MRQPLLLCLTALLLFSPIGHAQDAPDAAVSTDRPSIGSGPDLVPVRRVIVESGVSWSVGQGNLMVDLPETLVRVGLSSRFELRSTPPNIQHDVTNFQQQDAAVSAKVKLPSSEKWPVSSIVGVSAPTGSNGVSSGEWDPSFLLTTSHVWSPRLASFESGNVIWATNGANGRQPLTQMAFDGLWSTTSAVTSFVEWAPLYSPVPHSSGYTVDGGALWVLRRYVQLDLRVGRAVNDAQVRTVAGAGFSFSFRP
jgi:hypothetical protein